MAVNCTTAHRGHQSRRSTLLNRGAKRLVAQVCNADVRARLRPQRLFVQEVVSRDTGRLSCASWSTTRGFCTIWGGGLCLLATGQASTATAAVPSQRKNRCPASSRAGRGGEHGTQFGLVLPQRGADLASQAGRLPAVALQALMSGQERAGFVGQLLRCAQIDRFWRPPSRNTTLK